MKRLTTLVLLLLVWVLPVSAVLLFDGVDDRIIMAAVTGAPTGYPLAMAALVRHNGAGTGQILQLGTYGTVHTGIGFYWNAASQLNVYNFGTDLALTSTATMVDLAWTLVGYSSASATSHRFYAYNLDTRTVVMNETSTSNLGAITAPAAGLAIGTQVGLAGAYTQFFVGQMAWVAAYAKDMTIQNGDAFKAMAILGPEILATPALLYTFQEMTGTTVRERQNRGTVGTMTSFPASPWQPLALPGPHILAR